MQKKCQCSCFYLDKIIYKLILIKQENCHLFCIFAKIEINDNSPVVINSDFQQHEPVQHLNNIQNITIYTEYYI